MYFLSWEWSSKPPEKIHPWYFVLPWQDKKAGCLLWNYQNSSSPLKKPQVLRDSGPWHTSPHVPYLLEYVPDLLLIFLCLIGRCALPSRVVSGILVQRSEKTFHTTIPWNSLFTSEVLDLSPFSIPPAKAAPHQLRLVIQVHKCIPTSYNSVHHVILKWFAEWVNH